MKELRDGQTFSVGPALTCLDGAWPCWAHERHVLKPGRYNPGSTPEEYGAGDWEPAGDEPEVHA